MNKTQAFELLNTLKAPSHLITHATLVGEAGAQIIQCLTALKLDFSAEFVEAGIVLHDVGKMLHPREFCQPGKQHEAAGQTLLITHGVDPQLAQVCVSHGQWHSTSMLITLEELLIALADKLWKGTRVQVLEEHIINQVSIRLNTDYWTLFTHLDHCFETIAADGDSRLARSTTDSFIKRLARD